MVSYAQAADLGAGRYIFDRCYPRGQSGHSRFFVSSELSAGDLSLLLTCSCAVQVEVACWQFADCAVITEAEACDA